jgi:putative Mg2+ transporter-C (MgtC) family protein
LINSDYLTNNNWLNICVRLLFALLIGAMIGLERQLKHKPAGLRTHMLVSLGSAVFTLINIQLSGDQVNVDALSRVIQGITAGVGFLGAGEILRSSSQKSQSLEIHGLTTAAAIWVTAALGIAAGCGLWSLGLAGAGFTLVVLHLLKRLEKFDN